jgi:hypothetical protein
MIRLPDGDEIPDRVKHMFQSQKLMLTCVWNPHGSQVVDAMPKGEMFTAAYYIRISEIFSPRWLLGVEREAKGD